MSPTNEASGGLGRSGPKSRNGCMICKKRRVRCDESRPECRNCQRLQLECKFLPPRPRARRQPTTSRASSTTEPERMRSRDRSHSMSDALHNAELTAPVAKHVTESAPVLPASSYKPAISGDAAAHSPIQRETGAGDADSSRTITNNYEFPMSDISGGAYHSFTVEDHQSQSSFASPQDPASYSPNFGSFFGLPNMDSSFPTFSFVDSRAEGNFDLTQLLANIEGRNGANQTESLSTQPGISHQFEQAHVEELESNQPVGSQLVSSKSAEPHVETTTWAGSTPSLLLYFKRNIRLPASLISIDTFSWYQMQRYLVRLASKYDVVMHAMLALAQLSSVIETPLKSASSAEWKKAFELQALCIEGLKSAMSDQGVWPDYNTLLSAIFMLAWFEVLRDDQGTHHSTFPTDISESIIASQSIWNASSKRLLHWLNSFDAKASHLGGRQLLSPKSLEIVFRYRLEANEDEDDESLGDSNESDHGPAIEPPVRNSLSCPSDGKKRSTETFPKPRPLPSLHTATRSILSAIVQPAAEFHLVSQSFSRRIGSHDRHHRTRNTVEDEYEVVTACQSFDAELKRLWKQRPRVMDLTREQLALMLQPDMARQVEELLCVYAAGFWTHFLYIHRVAWWDLPHSETAKKAVENTWRMLKTSVGSSLNDDGENMNAQSLDAVIHPGLMWPIFLFGCECYESYQQQWSVAQLRALAEASGAIRHAAINTTDALGTSTPQQKGAQNAMRAAVLLEEIIRRQNKSQTRVDGKYVSHDLFGCHFTII